MTTQLSTIARLEFTAAARLNWTRVLMAALALLASAAAYSAGAADELTGPDGFARTTTALVPVVLILVPLAALILGISGQAAEAGSEPFLFSQPVGRTTVVIGRWIGESIALGGAIVVGLGVGGSVVVLGSGTGGVMGFAAFAFGAVALAMTFLSIAAAIAAAAHTRVAALGIGVFVWCVFVLLYDGAALSVAGWLTGSLGGRILLASVFGNPADLIRVVTLSVAGTPNVLGAAGEAWTRFLGGTTVASAAAIAALFAWMAAPLVVAVFLMSRRDL